MEHAFFCQEAFRKEDVAVSLAGIPEHPVNADDALLALDTVAARLASRGDGRAAFPDIYGIITRKVAEEVKKNRGIFVEPLWISRLAGRFCERYLETLRWSLDGAPNSMS